MRKRYLSIICLLLLIINGIINVYADTFNDNNSKSNEMIKEKDNNQFIKINNNVEIDKDINMILYLDNISYDNFTFKLYSNNSLEVVDTKDIDINNYNNEEISFDYCINCSSLKTISLNYKLPNTVNVGDKITFSVQLVNKDNEEEIMNYRTTVTVIDSIKKEEVEEDKEENSKKRSSISRNISSTGNRTGSSSSSNTSTTYKGSSNNYLSNIIVKGYNLNKTFTKERLTYFVTVPNSVKSLSINASKENSKATVNIVGNSNFSVGVNKVLITVTSEDGRVKNYRIYVTRLDSDINEE